jgi:hypothetical protein
MGVGISWFLNSRNGQQVVSHGGSDDGFRTTLFMLPARKTGLVVLANSDRAPIDAIKRKAWPMALGED